MNILSTTWAAIGHVNSLLGVLAEARARGHRVYCAHPRLTPESSSSLEARGIEVLSFDVELPPTPLPDFVALQNDLEAYCRFAAQFDIADRLIEGVERLIRRCAPDVMLTDATHYFSVIAAARAKIPYVCVPQGWPLVVSGRTTGNDLAAYHHARPARDALFERHGVAPQEFVQASCLSPFVNLLATTPELVQIIDPAAARPSFLLCGPIQLDSTDDQALPPGFPEGPFLYFTFGTLARIDNPTFDLVRAACRSLSLPLVATVGRQGAAATPYGDGVYVYDWLPQQLALARASVAVFHGGMNTFGDCCGHEVPMLIHPLHNDQFDTAICAVRSGVGHVLATEPSLVVGQIQALLRTDAAERAKLAVIGASYRSTRGSRVCVDRMEGLVAEHAHDAPRSSSGTQ